MATTIDFAAVVPRFDEILARGLSKGKGKRGGQVCIEAAVCEALGLPHGDNPDCVAVSVRSFKIALNDANWSSPEARAAGLRDLGIAQLGSRGVIDDGVFVTKLAEQTIRIFIPRLFRQTLAQYPKCLEAASRCETEGTRAAAWDARATARVAWDAAGAAMTDAEAARAAVWATAVWATAWAAAGATTWAAAWAAGDVAVDAFRCAAWATARVAGATAWAGAADEYLKLSAKIALDILIEMGSPGCAWLAYEKAIGRGGAKTNKNGEVR